MYCNLSSHDRSIVDADETTAPDSVLHYSCVYLLLKCHFTPLGSYSYPPAFVFFFFFLFFVMPLLKVVKLWLPTEREKRGWMGDSLAAHSAVSSFFDMRAAWTKWVDDMLFTQSMLNPEGAVPTIVPCIFPQGLFFFRTKKLSRSCIIPAFEKMFSGQAC